MLGSKKEKLSTARTVEITKLKDSRVGVGLVQTDKGIEIATVAATSPLEGLVYPGDIVRISQEGTTSSTRCPTPRARTAQALAAAFHAASSLSLLVETPELLSNAHSIFFLPSGERVGISLEEDRETGYARVKALDPGSASATRVGRDLLTVGDLIVAVSEGGTLFPTKNVKEATARLPSECNDGTLELRVVRPAGVIQPPTYARAGGYLAERAQQQVTAPPSYHTAAPCV